MAKTAKPIIDLSIGVLEKIYKVCHKPQMIILIKITEYFSLFIFCERAVFTAKTIMTAKNIP
jgi:hypothetical protein